MSGYKPREQRHGELLAAFRGIDLDARDRRFLDWFAGWDQDSTDRLASLVERVRTAARGAQ